MNAVLDMPAIAAGSRRLVERTFVSHDGAELFYRAWVPLAAEAASPPRGRRGGRCDLPVVRAGGARRAVLTATVCAPSFGGSSS